MNRLDKDYDVTDNFLQPELHKQVCDGVKSLHALFNDPDNTFNGNEFIMLGSIPKLKQHNVKTIPLFVKKYLDVVLQDDTTVFFQNILFINHMKNGIPWHVDSQIKDRVQESGMIKRSAVLQNAIPDIDTINVYYPFVPANMPDGQFHLKTSDGQEVELDIKPNRMIRIKGSIEHKTSSITPSDGEYRISMITEQVKLPKIFDKMIERDGFLYDGIFDDVIIDKETGHYTDWDRSGYYKDGKYVVS